MTNFSKRIQIYGIDLSIQVKRGNLNFTYLKDFIIDKNSPPYNYKIVIKEVEIAKKNKYELAIANLEKLSLYFRNKYNIEISSCVKNLEKKEILYLFSDREVEELISLTGSDYEMIALPYQMVFYNPKSKTGNVFYIHNEEVETGLTVAVNYCCSQILLGRYGFLAHAAGVVKRNKAYVFIARSGGGKTTVVNLCRGSCSLVLSDDIVGIRKLDSKYFAFSSPWIPGHIGVRRNVSFEIEAIFLLFKDTVTYLKAMSFKNFIKYVIGNNCVLFLCSNSPYDMKSIFFNLLDMFQNVPIFELHFEKNTKFLKVIEKECFNGMEIHKEN